jgi:hypothetical protein
LARGRSARFDRARAELQARLPPVRRQSSVRKN